MTDYTRMPLGPLAPDRMGEIVECPYCHRNGLKVQDFKDPASGSKEKETIYIHAEGAAPVWVVENGRTVETTELVTQACPAKIKPKPREETRRE